MPTEKIVIINGKEEKIPQGRNEFLLMELLEKITQNSSMYFCDTTAELPAETSSIPVGAVCAVINESKFFVLNSKKVWKLWDDSEDATSETSSVSPTSLALNKGLMKSETIETDVEQIPEEIEVQNEFMGRSESE